MNQSCMTYNDILWVLNNYEELSSGIWPDPITPESLCIKRSFLHSGWENCCLLSAEVAMRVKRCWPDGYLVEDRYGLRGGGIKDYAIIARQRWIAEEFVKEKIHRVICYCCDTEPERNKGYKNWYNTHRNRKDLKSGAINVRIS